MTNEELEEEVAREARLDRLTKRLSAIDLEAAALENKDILALATLELVRSVSELDKHLSVQEEQTKRVRRVGAVNSVLLFVTATAIVVIALLVSSNRNLSTRLDKTTSCIRGWSDAITQRSQTLEDLRTPRDKAIDAVFRSLTKENFREAFQTALIQYFKASDDYNDALEKNPLPPSPELDCR